MRTSRNVLLFSFIFAFAARAQDGAPAAAPVEKPATTAEAPAAATPETAAPAPAVPSVPAAQAPAPQPAAPAVDATAGTGEAAATPAEVPEARKPLVNLNMKTTKTAKYMKPMYFETADSGNVLPPPEIEYDLTLDEGKTLQIGNLKINEKTFLFVLKPLGTFNPQLASMLGKEGSEPALVMRWPAPLLRAGTLEMISRSGSVLWKYEITPEAVEAYKKQLESWKTSLKGRGVNAKLLNGGLFATQFTITGLDDKKAPFRGQNEIFRFCLTQTEGKAQTRLCSQRYQARSTAKSLIMGKVTAPVTPRVVVMNENGALKGVVPAPADAPSQFYADLANGESYEFLSQPSKLNLMDLSDTSKPGLLRVSGFGTRPTTPSIVLNPDRFGSVTKMLGFEPTITDTRKFWAAAMKADDPKLYFPGEGGGVFRQRFELAAIPRAALRPHLSSETPAGTYSDGVTLRGHKQPDSKLSSDQYSVTQDSRDPSLFSWSFKAQEAAEINRSYLTIEHDGKSYKSFFELYRAYANELSGRFTGVLTSGGMVIMAELAYNHWFENWFGWENAWLTKQRWGFSGRYFKSLTQVTVGSGKASLDALNLDAKYRFTPGLWTRDESHGAILSYQSVNFETIKAPMLGVGWFWARSMPRALDTLFNYLPLMDYPKWVDMEFIYYASSMSSNVTLGNNFTLNFHGQVLWKKNFFGEAGFGMKTYSFNDTSASRSADLKTFYGTLGMGLKF